VKSLIFFRVQRRSRQLSLAVSRRTGKRESGEFARQRTMANFSVFVSLCVQMRSWLRLWNLNQNVVAYSSAIWMQPHHGKQVQPSGGNSGALSMEYVSPANFLQASQFSAETESSILTRLIPARRIW